MLRYVVVFNFVRFVFLGNKKHEDRSEKASKWKTVDVHDDATETFLIFLCDHVLMK